MIRTTICLALLAACIVASSLAHAAPLFSENFDALPLGPNQEESLAGSQVWTSTAPAGWTVDRTGVPGFNNAANNNGVKEWIGWNFAKRDWWVQAAQDQGRSGFTRASGAVMVADPDDGSTRRIPMERTTHSSPAPQFLWRVSLRAPPCCSSTHPGCRPSIRRRR